MTVGRWKRIPRMSAPSRGMVSGGEKTETGRDPESVCGGREIGTEGLTRRFNSAFCVDCRNRSFSQNSSLVGFAVVHKVCDAVGLGPAVAFVSELRGPADHSRKRTIVTWTTSGIGGESASGGRQETSTSRVVVEAVDDLQRIEQGHMWDTGDPKSEAKDSNLRSIQASHVIALRSLSALSALQWWTHSYDILFLDALVIPPSSWMMLSRISHSLKIQACHSARCNYSPNLFAYCAFHLATHCAESTMISSAIPGHRTKRPSRPLDTLLALYPRAKGASVPLSLTSAPKNKSPNSR
jgi:hypothetical protein